MPKAPVIMIIRHAEKSVPELGGVQETGEDDIHSLAIRGWQRAGALVGLFAPMRRELPDARLVRPKYLMAESPEAEGSEPKKSQREEQTFQPLAEMLGVEPDFRFGRGQEAEAAEAAKGCDGPVLLVWEHKGLIALARGIAEDAGIPEKWPSDRFDVVFVFRLGADGEYGFAQVPQMVLAGDTEGIIAADSLE